MKSEELTTDKERAVEMLTDSTTMAHPAGTGIGAVAGAMAGGAAGSLAGPAGTIIGALAGAVVGGVGGNATAAAISPTEEELYWSENHPSQLYGNDDEFDFEDYRPAYRMGISGPGRHAQGFDAAEKDMEAEWAEARGNSRLDWPRAKPAVRAAWDRVVSQVSEPAASAEEARIRVFSRSLPAGSSEGARMTP